MDREASCEESTAGIHRVLSSRLASPSMRGQRPRAFGPPVTPGTKAGMAKTLEGMETAERKRARKAIEKKTTLTIQTSCALANEV